MAESAKRFRTGDGFYIPVPQKQPAPAKVPVPEEVASRRDRLSPPAPGGQAAGESRWVRVGSRKVTILGTGSVGSHSAYALAQMGFELVLVDGQKVEASNVEGGRSAFLPETIGMSKPAALAHTFARIGIRVETSVLCRATGDLTDQEIRALGSQSDAVLASFDDPGELLRVNRLLYRLCPVVYPGFHQGARTGHVIWTAPGVTPCFACSIGVTSPDELRTLHGEPGFPPDIRRIADMAARVVAWLSAEESSESAELLDPASSIIFMDNRPSGSAERALSVRLLSADRSPECEVCYVNSNSQERR